jgi:hypothetical protein
MNNSFEKNCGIALIIFTTLLLFTMVLHPAGGSTEHLIRIATTIIISHSVAILSLPFGWIGFWGLTKRLGTDHFLSMMGFGLISLGLIAVLLAATVNGIVMPLFLQHFESVDAENITLIKPILEYGFSINHAFDYIYSVSFILAILCWSVAIICTRKLNEWIGYFGIGLFLMLSLLLISGVAVNSLKGLRFFFSGVVGWIILSGVALLKQGSK